MADGVREAVGDGVGVGLLLGLPEAVPLAVGLRLGVGLGVAVALRLREEDFVAEGVWLPVKEGDGVSLSEALGLGVSVELVLGDRVQECEGLAPEHPAHAQGKWTAADASAAWHLFASPHVTFWKRRWQHCLPLGI